MSLRRALAAPFQLALPDLLAAVAIAVLALSLMAGAGALPGQHGRARPGRERGPGISGAGRQPGPGPQTAAPTVLPQASPAPTRAPASPAASSPRASTPAASPGSSSPAAAEPTAAPSPAPSLASGAHSTQDPCPDPYAPSPGATRDPNAPPLNLCPAQPNGADPMSLLAWVFTPIFQVIFLGLAFFYSLTGDIGVAIILLTIVIRILLIPVFRAQIVSQRRMQMLQPELRPSS